MKTKQTSPSSITLPSLFILQYPKIATMSSSSSKRQFTWVSLRDKGKRSAPISSHWVLNLVVPNIRYPSFISCVCHRPAYLLWWILKIKVQRWWRRWRLFSFSGCFIASLAFKMLQIKDSIRITGLKPEWKVWSLRMLTHVWLEICVLCFLCIFLRGSMF